MADRGRETKRTDDKLTRSRSRSRVRMSLKKIMKGIGRKSGSKSVGGDSESIASSPTVSGDTTTPKSKTETTKATTQSVSSLQLVLLLLDSTTRRFELLQLEFDSRRARVSDLFAQIPVSVTDNAIKKQAYEGVIGETHELKAKDALLVEFCKEKQVLVALPTEMTVKECVRFAQPILNDVQVLKMLSHGGFDTNAWKKNVSAKEEEEITITSERSIAKESNKKTFPIFAVLAIIAIIAQVASKYVMTPIQIGVPLAPGTTRSKCGINGFLPTFISKFAMCDQSIMKVGYDGKVSFYDEDGELKMSMQGGVCDSNSCFDGILMEADGSVYIGGKQVRKIMKVGGDKTITPWPFEEMPKLKVKSVVIDSL